MDDEFDEHYREAMRMLSAPPHECEGDEMTRCHTCAKYRYGAWGDNNPEATENLTVASIHAQLAGALAMNRLAAAMTGNAAVSQTTHQHEKATAPPHREPEAIAETPPPVNPFPMWNGVEEKANVHGDTR